MRNFYFICVLLVTGVIPVFAQTSTQGKDFIISFGDVATGSAVSFLQIATSEATTVSFKYNNSSGLNNTVTIPAGTVQRFDLSSNQIRQHIEAATTSSNRTLEIHADTTISVYILNASSNSGDATVVLPYTALGTDYYHASYPLATGNVYDAFIIAAIENGTTVYRDGVLVGNLAAGQSIRYRFARNTDGTGAHITSNNPIAFFISNHEALIPPGNNNRSMLMEQQMPVNRWGRSFLVPVVSQPGLDRDEKIRVIASQPGTNIEYWRHSSPTSTTVSISSAGGYVDIPTGGTADSTFWIQANNPIGVYTYLHSVPAISQIPPVQQSVSSTVIAPFNTAGTPLTLTGHYAIVVTPTVTRDQTRYVEGAGTEMSLNGWITGANGGSYSYTTLPLTPTSSYLFKNNFGVIVWVYGLGNNASYYYVAGAATRELTDRFFLDSIGDIDGQTLCFDKMIEIKADLMLPISPKPGHLKWYLNSVEDLAVRDSFTWTLPFLPNGIHTITLEALDVFDSIHVLSAEFTQDCPQTLAVPDTVAVLSCIPEDTIDVLANDSLGMCSFGTIEVILPSAISAAGGSAYINSDKELIYTPPPNFAGWDSIEYALFCTDTLSAQVYILVMECPDNIFDDAKCYGESPPTAWDIKELDRSDAYVHAYAQPLVGDFDGCGKNEVIAHNYVSAQTSDRLLIFDDQLKLKDQILLPPSYNYLVYPISIADVDGDGRAEIYVLTGATTTRTLQCFSFNGTTWVAKPGFSTSTVTLPTASSVGNIVIGDINGDGIPELFVYDRIINSITGAVIATLPPTGSRGMYNAYLNGNNVQYAVLADMDNDGVLDIVCGNEVYKAQINNGSTSGMVTSAYYIQAVGDIQDGFTSVADIDLDGYLDVIVTHNDNHVSKAYVWSPYKGVLLGQTMIGNTGSSSLVSSGNVSRAFIGDVNNDGYPEIAFSYYCGMVCFRFNPGTGNFDQLWRRLTTDTSGMTTMSMFDFNQDNKQEIIYRDETHLRIMDGETGLNVDSIICYSGTASEMPIVVDLSGEGHAQIIVSGALTNINPAPNASCLLRRYVSVTPGAWAPARKVWNQHGYNAVNINDDLTVPRFQLNPATVFPNGQRPYNGFLMQQTWLNINGDPLWPLPNIDTTSLITTTVTATDVIITIGVVNKGDAMLVAPVYVSVYKESDPQTYNTADFIASGIGSASIPPGALAYININIPVADIISHLPMSNMVIRVNDDGTTFPYREECDIDSNEVTIPNPLRHLMMKKDATLYITPPGPIEHNGFYANPVATLFGDTIEYRITAANGYTTAKDIYIIDTLPSWLNYDNLSSSHTVTWTYMSGTPDFNRFEWLETVASMDSVVITFRATLEEGVSASQPLFANRAWVKIGDDELMPTNYTWHQGAGVCEVTFSAGYGGKIYQAMEQALDYRTSPRSGIVIVPDEGYRFAGWSHEGYLSLRGVTIPAQSGVMRYEMLTVYGNVELHANFEPERYPIIYYLNGGENAEMNPLSYTIESDTITLIPAQKTLDEFIGWTGSNGDEPQLSVTIPAHSTGERVYYANYRYNGRAIDVQQEDSPSENRIWAFNNTLYVRTIQPGSILRIYSLDGVLQNQQIILQPGETTYRLPNGLYLITLNNGIGRKIMIND